MPIDVNACKCMSRHVKECQACQACQGMSSMSKYGNICQARQNLEIDVKANQIITKESKKMSDYSLLL